MPATLIQDVNQELKRLSGLAVDSAQTSTLTTADPRKPAETLEVQLDFLVVDRLSCALRELRLNVPSLANAPAETLSDWAKALCARITYLLEGIGPLEFEPEAGSILIRSTEPTGDAGKKLFYEVLLQSQSGGSFSLKRFESIKGQPGRSPVDLHLTHEVLGRLVDDLVDTIPV